jgi:hypothetical protein
MSLGCALTDPLTVTDHHVIAVRFRGPLGSHKIIKTAPWFLNDIDLDASLFFIEIADFLKIVRRIPFSP